MRVLLVSPSPKLPGGIARWTKHVLSYYEEHKETCKYVLTNQYTCNNMKMIQETCG